jgi:hypothetical protein
MDICYYRTSWPKGVSHPGQHLAPKIRLGIEEEPEGRNEIEWTRRQLRVSRDIPLDQHCLRTPRARQFEHLRGDIYASRRGNQAAQKLQDTAGSAGQIGDGAESAGNHVDDDVGEQSLLDEPLQPFRRTRIPQIFVIGPGFVSTEMAVAV